MTTDPLLVQTLYNAVSYETRPEKGEQRGEYTLRVLVAEGTLSHICQLDGALRARIHEPIAANGVKFGGGNDLGQLFHISGFDVHDIEALILDIQVPEVDSQIIAAYESFAVAVDRDAVDVVGMGISICAPGDRSDDSIVMRQSRKLQLPRGLEVRLGNGSRGTSSHTSNVARCQVVR